MLVIGGDKPFPDIKIDHCHQVHCSLNLKIRFCKVEFGIKFVVSSIKHYFTKPVNNINRFQLSCMFNP